MAMTACKECKGEVSATAATCPHCGAKRPRVSLGVKVFGVLAGVFILSKLGGSPEPLPPRAAVAPVPVAAPVRAPGAAVAALRKEVDAVEKVTWYHARSSPDSIRRSAVYAYIGDRGERPWLRLRVQYEAERWLFVKSATFVIDGEKAAKISGRWQRDNDSRVYEWLDASVGDEEGKLIKQILGAKQVTVRYEGENYHHDRKLTTAELQAFKQVTAAYSELGGQL